MRTERNRRIPRAAGGQAGFSMIEMLMTAFVLAVGILGLTMLQAMSLKAARGSRSLSTAVLVAEQVMDQVELEGRLCWLNRTNTSRATPSQADLPNLRYIALADGGELVETFNAKGGAVDASSADPAVSTPFFTVTTRRALRSAPTVGQISDITVLVDFVDNVDRSAAPVHRQVTLTRSILHG